MADYFFAMPITELPASVERTEKHSARGSGEAASTRVSARDKSRRSHPPSGTAVGEGDDVVRTRPGARRAGMSTNAVRKRKSHSPVQQPIEVEHEVLDTRTSNEQASVILSSVTTTAVIRCGMFQHRQRTGTSRKVS